MRVDGVLESREEVAVALGSGSGRCQKVSDLALDVLLPASNFQSVNELFLTLQDLL